MIKAFKLEEELRTTKDKYSDFDKILKESENTILKQQHTIEELNEKIDELEAFKLTTLDKTVHQLAEQEDLMIHAIDQDKRMTLGQLRRPNESQDLPTFGCMSFNPKESENPLINPLISIKSFEL